MTVILNRRNGEKARIGRYLGRSSRPTHHRDAKEGRRWSGNANGMIDHNRLLLPFDKDLANRVASTTTGAGSAASCHSERGTILNKSKHRSIIKLQHFELLRHTSASGSFSQPCSSHGSASQ